MAVTTKHQRYNVSAKGRARARKFNERRVRMSAGNVHHYLGTAPTTEDALQLRQRIRKEAPHGASKQP